MSNWKDAKQRLEAQGYRVGSLHEDRVRVACNGKWGFVDPGGNVVVPLKYDYVLFFCEGRAWVKLCRKFGFVDPEGTEVIHLQYDYADDFHEGRARVKLNGEEFFISPDGSRLD